ncbi:MAG: glycosyltransferase [Acidimicrobiia bacterium]|nr:glycosyltransferase [Acidimicrobiia bacterium]
MLLLASDYEGTPNVVLEAMAAGLPVVAGPVGDVPALLADVDHHLGLAGDVSGAALADEMALIGLDPARWREAATRNLRYVEHHHSVDVVTHQLLELYRDLRG